MDELLRTISIMVAAMEVAQTMDTIQALIKDGAMATSQEEENKALRW